jgi:hypothetical protein
VTVTEMVTGRLSESQCRTGLGPIDARRPEAAVGEDSTSRRLEAILLKATRGSIQNVSKRDRFRSMYV